MRGYRTQREPQRCAECQRELQYTHRRVRRPVCADCRLGYRVDVWLTLPQSYTEYTALRAPVTLAMAEALARGLKRQGAAGRIVTVPGGEVVEEWSDGR